jgi:hypothetical protein
MNHHALLPPFSTIRKYTEIVIASIKSVYIITLDKSEPNTQVESQAQCFMPVSPALRGQGRRILSSRPAWAIY